MSAKRVRVEVSYKRINQDNVKDVSTTTQVYEDMSAETCLEFQKAVVGMLLSLAEMKLPPKQ